MSIFYFFIKLYFLGEIHYSMPCKICNSVLIYVYDYPTCPKCEHLTLVPPEDAVKISNYLLEKYKVMFFDLVRVFKKTHLLSNIFWQRENEIRKFLQQYSTLNIARLLSCTLLLRRIFQIGSFFEQNDVNEEDANKVIMAYEALTDFEEACIKLKANHFTMVKLFRYDLNNLQNLEIGDKIIIFPNEQYDRIMSTFEKFNVMSAETAESKMHEWKKQNVPSRGIGTEKSYTSKDTIARFYGLISSLYIAFYRSELYLEAFGLPDEKLDLDPIEIKKFVTRHEVHHNTISITKYRNFKDELNDHFGTKSSEFENNFVLSEDNLQAFPLFVKFENNVLNSQAYGELHCYFLHAILNKDLFDDETKRSSKEFEGNIVKSKFEGRGFIYKAPFQIKGKHPMEIDGIAISDSHVYVIEVKGWGAKRLIEEKSSEDILIRDIKNSIFGYHYVAKTNTLKKKVSLLKKVEWVSVNRSKFGISPRAEITGLLVINEHPPFSECAGCAIEFVDDLTVLK